MDPCALAGLLRAGRRSAGSQCSDRRWLCLPSNSRLLRLPRKLLPLLLLVQP